MEKLTIMGAMCISRNPEMLKITIPNLLKYSDSVLLLLDNESPEVLELALYYQKKYYNKIWLRRSSIPHTIYSRSGRILTYRQRWKGVKEFVRDEIFVQLRRISKYLTMRKKDYNSNIDILLFPDQDEIFTDYLPELLEKFWDSDKRGVILKMIHPVGDMKTIKYDNMVHHLHIMKYSDDLCGMPWQMRNMMHPITGADVMRVEYYSAHLCYLTSEERMWRKDNWKNNQLMGEPIWRLEKDVEHLSPQEIKDILETKSIEIFCDV